MRDEDGMRIGEVARLTGIPGRRIRFYEERGLISPASRSGAGYRLYGEGEVARLEFIKLAKTLGLTLREILALISVAGGCSTNDLAHHLQVVIAGKLRQTRQRISDLTALEGDLLRFQSRAAALNRGEIESPCDSESRPGFCGCLDAVTGPREEVNMEAFKYGVALCICSCACCHDAEQSCTCACECCAEQSCA